MIPLNKPYLPPKEEYEEYLTGIWQRQWLTNMGKLSNDLEQELKAYLKVKHLLLVSNGTLGLHMAIKALDLKGEIITTPYSFVATTNSIVWEGCKPVFVDINPHTLNIDADKIEAAITEKTTAILATHIFGNPCEVETIQKIANEHQLKIIFDAAQAFGVEINGKSIFEFGDISICSLHATKLYHTAEGGLLITKQPKVLKKLMSMRDHGFNGQRIVEELGINAKNSELHAALGLANLNNINRIMDKRRELTLRYQKNLSGYVNFPKWSKKASKNYNYLSVIFESEEQLLKCKNNLEAHDIQVRRYFYPPLVNRLLYLEPAELRITEDIAKKVLCLPLYFDLTFEEVDYICDLILHEIKYGLKDNKRYSFAKIG